MLATVNEINFIIILFMQDINMSVCAYLQIVIELTIKKGGKQPYSIKMGNNKLPDKEPKRPNIIDNDATEVLHKGKKKKN